MNSEAGKVALIRYESWLVSVGRLGRDSKPLVNTAAGFPCQTNAAPVGAADRRVRIATGTGR